MNYPREWPGFEVTADGAILRAGAIVEGADIVDYSDDPVTGETKEHEPRIACRLLDEKYLVKASAARHPRDRWTGSAVHSDLLRPLTPAAREMLAALDDA